jgi:signal transduction histidine kinase
VSVQCGDVPEVAVEADDLLDRVFDNLLTNAVDHNDAPNPEVTVEAERRADVVTVRIVDNGPGIAPERRDSIFEKNERGVESDGTGFGLYLVRDVVESYGGDVRVRDNDPRGTVFEFDLPVASADR